MNLNLKHPYVGLAAAVALLIFLGLCTKYCNPSTPKKFRWTFVTAWSEDLPILTPLLKEMAVDITKKSNGRLEIIFRSAVNLTDANSRPIHRDTSFARLARNQIQMFHAAAYYWGNIPGSAFFSAVPFGMTKEEMEAWMRNQGLTLWRELYNRNNLYPFACGHTHQQMGGWFNFDARFGSQYKNKKIRIAGLGGQVLRKLGALPQTDISQYEIYNLLANNRIHGAEWIGPYHDFALNLHKSGDGYYEPGWQEYNTMFELIINKAAWNSLPKDLQGIVQDNIEIYSSRISNEFSSKNAEYREKMEKLGNVHFEKFSDGLLDTLFNHSKNVIQAYVKGDTLVSKIAKSYYNFPAFKTRFDTLGKGFKERASQIGASAVPALPIKK